RLGMNTGMLEDIYETLILTDYGEICPDGLIRYVPIKVNGLLMEVDFVVLDIDEDESLSYLEDHPQQQVMNG
ncbi:hypothetical protein A2U01_0093732, partial [Trifolium medium]|nr:hypothetical protein [Trifolium medium]